jgi:hypothetical protein
MNYDFQLTGGAIPSQAAVWVPQPATYNELRGFWIFEPNVRKCWAAARANGPLIYWNQDGGAKWPPQDHEMFVFEDADAGRIRIKNIWGRYVVYHQSAFHCIADQGDAAQFVAES